MHCNSARAVFGPAQEAKRAGLPGTKENEKRQWNGEIHNYSTMVTAAKNPSALAHAPFGGGNLSLSTGWLHSEQTGFSASHTAQQSLHAVW
jgi:hypothetical protein